MEEKRYMTVSEVAEYLTVRPSTIRTWTRDRKIPTIALGSLVRYDKEQIDKWMADREVARV